MGTNGAGEDILGLVAGDFEKIGGLIPPIGKLGGILISGVRGLAMPSIALALSTVTLGEGWNGGGVPIGLGGICPLREGGKGEGVVDPETDGLVSSATKVRV
ncbi:MAG: hypothetical protein HYT65_02355 [Candidatus Yanofskybacteria bacterium]|nr:hypothetical protein [Candidatus Yanofskybacteria bacterium]